MIIFATQFVQLIFNCGMLRLWNKGDGIKQTRPTDTHNTFINRHCIGGGGVFLIVTAREFPAQGSFTEEEGMGGGGWLIN